MSSYRTLAGVIIMISLIVLVVMLIILILQIVAKWKLYDEAGENGWAAIVPFYSYFTYTKIAMGNYTLAWVYTVIYIICSILSFIAISLGRDSGMGKTIDQLATFVNLGLFVVNSLVSYFFGKAFGKSTAWNVLMIFFNGIMIIVMGLSRHKNYIGPKGEYDNYGY